MDVTIVTPLQTATMPGAANTAGHALDYAHGRKANGAEEECRRQGIAFLPLVAETFGGWHTGAQREVKKLAAAFARHTGLRQHPTSGAGWESSSNGAMPLSWAIECLPCLEPMLMESSRV